MALLVQQHQLLATTPILIRTFLGDNKLTAITLYEIGAEYRALAAQLADLDLPPEAIADTLEGEVSAFENKARAVACVLSNLEAEAEAYTAHAKKATERAKALQARVTGLQDYLRIQMELCDISEIKGHGLLLKLQNNPASVEVLDEAQIPAKYMRTPTPPPAAPDKKSISDDLKAGIDVPGCKLKQTRRLVIK